MTRIRTRIRPWALRLFPLLLLAGCGSSAATDGSAGTDGAGGGGDGNPPGAATPVESVPLSDTIMSGKLGSAVDVVRDEWGIPHIYGSNFADVAFAQGYTHASDRLVLMDLGRRQAEGSLAELVGDQLPTAVDRDIAMRVHHLRSTAQQTWDQLKASTDDSDKFLCGVITSYVAGINAYVDDLKSGKYSLAPALLLFYAPASASYFDEVDVMALGALQAFDLAFDANSEISRTLLDAAATAKFDNAVDPSLLLRKGIGQDLQILAPIDPTHTIAGGWTGMNGDTSTASLPLVDDGNLLALLGADKATLTDIGNDHLLHPARGSNNWVIGPSLSTTGHVLVANDTHLSLGNPPTFYLNHLVVKNDAHPANVMGVQFAGIPGVILGMNEHVAWGATVNNVDVTDVYQETVVPCDGNTNPCVTFKNTKVALVPRVETFKVGSFGDVKKTIMITLYDVPHHGPVIPRVTPLHRVEMLGSSELSIRYTGYEPAQLFRAVFGVDTAKSMKEAVAALDRDFKYGGQNWVIGDDQGHFGWTQVIRVPRRAPGHAPWKVLPGDGSAEWGADMEPKYIPHAYDPMQGYIATANNDPIGVTDDNDPFFDEPMQGGSPLYLGADYDPGTRVGRITKRILGATQGGNKLGLDDMQSIQADAVTEWGQQFAPLLAAAAQALLDEQGSPGKYPELSALVTGADVKDLANLGKAQRVVASWTFDTPSATADETPTATQIVDSGATLVHAEWLAHFAADALNDELTVLRQSVSETEQRKLLAAMTNDPRSLKTGLSQLTGDSILFDDLGTPAVVESKRYIAAKALLETLTDLRKRLGDDLATWRWGQAHTLTLAFPAGVDALNIPTSMDPKFPTGFPRHGDDGTVDVGAHGLSTTDFSYSEGPAIRFVCELTPTGPVGRNALPGGETFDPHSPHYRDQMERWRQNKTFDLAFHDDAVIASAMKEYAAHMIGRVRFTNSAH